MVPQNWIQLLEPDLYLPGSVLSITPQLIQQYQVQGMIFDVDDTIVSTRTQDVSPDVAQWIQEIKPLVRIALVSNNLKHSRIRRVAKRLEVPYYFGAGKPSRRSLRKALVQMDLQPHQVAMVGDRLFTDVLAGNRLGMLSILVDPIHPPQVSVTKTGLLRAFEIWLSRRLGASISNKVQQPSSP
ncbi:YqeG family HAD IIIA-type phosphatase [Lyngbya confervoides]|uniref:YqeG family HAD IIIA-type phosphatase n=1 Tax=Lyngbya confervoides BDU141951 TaxID=1574623 RepID=A0ABD4SY97_9CYAN|nr:YqeG family HAD IIIA-type phosphatase [Lyngbya confervoides]MCM1981365.1 YqeG family HAD IIIA-type phosphatase [Lyngbya confervoides BDU141951]